jgi:t-SNARE complex subunit (syntaxin)
MLAPSESGHLTTATKGLPEGCCDPEAATRPAKSSTARIVELSNRNTEVEVELEHWKSVASQAELLNRDLGATLEAAQSDAKSLQLENERITETCRQIMLAAKFHHTEASQAKKAFMELFRTFESIRTKVSVPSKKQ